MPESMHPNAQADGPTGPHPEPGPTPEERAMNLVRQLFPGAGKDVDRRVKMQPIIAAEIRAAEQAAEQRVLEKYGLICAACGSKKQAMDNICWPCHYKQFPKCKEPADDAS